MGDRTTSGVTRAGVVSAARRAIAAYLLLIVIISVAGMLLTAVR